MILGKQRRLQFVECSNDITGMVDAAEFADLALLLTDGSYEFEMAAKSELGNKYDKINIWVWKGLQTVAELGREKNLPIPLNKDSLYQPIERRPKKFNPLVMPSKLQAPVILF
ncbi:hypothetical protein ZOSMA_5G01950 [Zostera marina]|uniref:Uncharacterized protein n=1 Tax=Zostera marina TaxID=29655 RepID=A0A0K9NUM0_ZOSMR|nr:hypothetical protein ZOSMA_5G01950 [Zostera marina]